MARRLTFDSIVGHLWKNQDKYVKLNRFDYPDFDYPDYGGLPRYLSRYLSTEFVDAIQQILDSINIRNNLKGAFKTKRAFSKALENALCGLGEKVS